MTDRATVDELTRQLRQLVLADEGLAGIGWGSLSVVFEIDDGSRGMEAWRYLGTNFAPLELRNRDVLRRARDLRSAMRAANGHAWQACRLAVVRPGPSVELEFAYGANPWRLRAVSLDLREHAMSLRSGDHPRAGDDTAAKD